MLDMGEERRKRVDTMGWALVGLLVFEAAFFVLFLPFTSMQVVQDRPQTMEVLRNITLAVSGLIILVVSLMLGGVLLLAMVQGLVSVL
jgi:hypothetical protein